MRYITVICSLFFLSLSSVAFSADLGDVAGSWESRGHWSDAGSFGVVCEQRIDGKPFKVKVYQRVDGVYQEYTGYRFWPDSCGISTELLQEKWGDLGTVVEDTAFQPEQHRAQEPLKKQTLRRWFIE